MDDVVLASQMKMKKIVLQHKSQHTLEFYGMLFIRGFFSRAYVAIRSRPAHRGFQNGLRNWTIVSTAVSASGLAYYWQSQRAKIAELSPDHFTPYKITHKQDIDSSHFLMELTPLKKQRTNLWSKMGSENLWSVEIKQPDIMVVRNYTPLPLLFDIQTKELTVMEDGDFADGKLCFYIKQYTEGEVARWLHQLPNGHVLELRGPFIEYELPHYKDEVKRNRRCLSNGSEGAEEDKFVYQPFDIAMFTAGTGIVSALQLLLTESPFRGTIDLFYSCRNIHELGPIKSVLINLQKHGRVHLHLSESSKEPVAEARLKTIFEMALQPTEYLGQVPFKEIRKGDLEPVLSLVCGPERYIAAIAGLKYDPAQGPIGGLLKKRGWSSENVYKLS